MNRVMKFKTHLPDLNLIGNVVELKGSNNDYGFYGVVAEIFINGKQQFYSTGNFILLQFTGLKSSDNTELWEGDKCLCRVCGFDADLEDVETEIIYDLTVGAFAHKVISPDSDYKFFGLNSKHLISCKVIGHVHEVK